MKNFTCSFVFFHNLIAVGLFAVRTNVKTLTPSESPSPSVNVKLAMARRAWSFREMAVVRSSQSPIGVTRVSSSSPPTMTSSQNLLWSNGELGNSSANTETEMPFSKISLAFCFAKLILLKTNQVNYIRFWFQEILHDSYNCSKLINQSINQSVERLDDKLIYQPIKSHDLLL